MSKKKTRKNSGLKLLNWLRLAFCLRIGFSWNFESSRKAAEAVKYSDPLKWFWIAEEFNCQTLQLDGLWNIISSCALWKFVKTLKCISWMSKQHQSTKYKRIPPFMRLFCDIQHNIPSHQPSLQKLLEGKRVAWALSSRIKHNKAVLFMLMRCDLSSGFVKMGQGQALWPRLWLTI